MRFLSAAPFSMLPTIYKKGMGKENARKKGGKKEGLRISYGYLEAYLVIVTGINPQLHLKKEE